MTCLRTLRATSCSSQTWDWHIRPTLSSEMISLRIVVIMLISTVLICLAEMPNHVSAIVSPRPRLNALIHALVHDHNSPCNQLDLLNSDSASLHSYEESIRNGLLKRQSNSTLPVTTSPGLPVSVSSSTTSQPPLPSSPRATSQRTTSQAPVPTPTSMAQTSSTTPATMSTTPRLSSASSVDSPASSTQGNIAVVPVGAVSTGASSLSSTESISSTSVDSSTMTPSATTSDVSSSARSSSLTVPVSPSGIGATLSTSTVLLVVQGASGPMTSTSTVLVWVANATPTTVTTQPALQSNAMPRQIIAGGSLLAALSCLTLTIFTIL